MMINPNIIQIGGALSAGLDLLSQRLSPIRLTAGVLDPGVCRHYRAILRGMPELGPVISKLTTDLASDRTARGYVVLDGVPLGNDTDLRFPTALCCLAGLPFRVVDRKELWQELGVNLSAYPNRFGGIGYNPLHIDVVNSTRPPDLVSLCSVRSDPLGGGQTIVSNLQLAASLLSRDEQEQLQRSIFREGQFYGMSGVGHELNPFPVLQPRIDGLWTVRFTGKMLPDMAESPDKRLAQKFERNLIQNQETFLLQPNQLLIANQLLVAHGRLALGTNQESVPADQRRLLFQSYLHADRGLPQAHQDL
jgi:alpha-ketoglutarate-dependent taurine dioxygenase